MALTDRSPTPQADELTPRSRWVGARMTLDEFLTLPEEKPSLEWDRGVVAQKSVLHADQGALMTEMMVHLAQVGEARHLGIVFAPRHFVIPGWAPVPDVSYIRKERLKPASRRRFGKVEIPPDIAVEIVSPDQSVGELLKKCLRYAEIGVAISLVVDRDDETIYAIRPDQRLQVLRVDDRIDLTDILPGFELTVQALFDSIVPDWLIQEPEPEA
jgi:Uma2 family endonuclease